MSDPIDAAIEAAQPHLVPALDITLPDGRVARLPYPLSVVEVGILTVAIGEIFTGRAQAQAQGNRAVGAILTPAGPRLVR